MQQRINTVRDVPRIDDCTFHLLGIRPRTVIGTKVYEQANIRVAKSPDGGFYMTAVAIATMICHASPGTAYKPMKAIPGVHYRRILSAGCLIRSVPLKRVHKIFPGLSGVRAALKYWLIAQRTAFYQARVEIPPVSEVDLAKEKLVTEITTTAAAAERKEAMATLIDQGWDEAKARVVLGMPAEKCAHCYGTGWAEER